MTTMQPRVGALTRTVLVAIPLVVALIAACSSSGDDDDTVAVAEDTEGGGPFPVGTIIQLVPQEAMVKRAPGFDPDSNDWEFFALDVSPEGTKIVTRGGAEVVNQ